MADLLGYTECTEKFNVLMDDYVYGEIKTEEKLRKKLNGTFLKLHAENKLDVLHQWQAKTAKALIGKMVRDARYGRKRFTNHD